ncbi:hypothetical protein L1049_025798 [Liquidambar formosana]|uniref:DC1 domain-containing protein n=1 Tax=Liquidambar formosana TaxID=63359 RepID=A0AAP0R4W6_LIQFO
MMSNESYTKPQTFHLNKSSSMELATSPRSTIVPAGKSSSIEFPTSHPLMGEEFFHDNHRQHPLAPVSLTDLFTCTGCREYGAGKRFICRQCDFQLHEFCALAPSVLKGHPLHYQHQLFFNYKQVKGGIVRSKCDICGKPSKGYHFQCSACSFLMHPCCAMLSAEIKVAVHPHSLKLLSPGVTSGGSGEPGFSCGECKKKRLGRVYGCGVCDYHLHAVCAKNMVNGLHANNIKDRENRGMLGTAARLASQVVIGFLGGLIEGLGDGVGQVLVQNIGKGRRLHSRRYD